MNENLYKEFDTWLDGVLSHDGARSMAYNFNLYEHSDEYAVQLIGSDEYDAEDSTWALNETFSTGENLFLIPTAVAGDDWQTAVLLIGDLVREYIRSGRFGAHLASATAVCVGFVDGDIELVYSNPAL